ncbi:MAG TPA: ribbon-helix-helix domain-containing protein [Acidimicrobiia bacterium]|nr:ribbon-helix-helix domain-containing protein [Acidimicrobiia bacterium]
MTMFSFRVDEDEAEEARRWAEQLGVDRSELLRDALHRYLVRLRAEQDIDSWTKKPMTADEVSLAAVAVWGPAEDWTDWMIHEEG